MNANQIHSAMHSVYGDKCFWSEQFRFGVKWMEGGQKFQFVSYIRVQSVVFQRHVQQPASFFCIGHSEVCWQI